MSKSQSLIDHDPAGAGGQRSSQAGLAAELLRVAGELTSELDTLLSPHHVTVRQAGALRVLSDEPGLSYTELANACGVTKQSMQIIVRHLEKLHVVRRIGPGGSGNTARLHVTERGTELLAVVEASLETVSRRLTAGLSDQALSVLHDALGKVPARTRRPKAGHGS